MSDKKSILNKEVAAQKLHRMALEVAENLSGDNAELILIGVRQRGSAIAQKVGALLPQYMSVPIKIISIFFDKDIPKEIELSEPVDFTGKNVIVVDDVSNSGKTLLYAMKPLLDFYPKSVQTMVLIERMHKLYPIKPDYVGLSLATTKEDLVHIDVENGEITGVVVSSE
jgi:pyrimidine operon attenuation protein / uracil phosphoribosyltransferase